VRHGHNVSCWKGGRGGVKAWQRWDREGRLEPERTSTGWRSYSKAMLDAFMHRSAPVAARVTIVYCPASRAAQQPDLKNQRRVWEESCTARGVANVEFVAEVGGRLNLKRPKFVAISACSAEHGHDDNTAIAVTKLGLAKAEATRGDTTPLRVHANAPASVADEPKPKLCTHVPTFRKAGVPW
jgi:hypothetical protein